MDVPEEVTRSSGFILIRDTVASSGAFLLFHYLLEYLKDPESSVLFIALEQTFFHYSNIAKKLGVVLSSAVSKGRLFWIDALSTPYNWCASSSSGAQQAAHSDPEGRWSHDGSEACLRQLYARVERFVQRCAASGQRARVLLEGAELLTAGREELEGAVGDLVAQAAARVEACGGSFVVLLHQDTEDPLAARLAYRARLEASVEPLESGYSAEFAGQMVLRFAPRLERWPWPRPTHPRLLLRLTDAGLRCCPPGTAPL